MTLLGSDNRIKTWAGGCVVALEKFKLNNCLFV